MSQLLVRLLGPPAVEWEGDFLEIPRRKVRALFFRLAIDMRPVAREHLTYLFWADKPDAVAHRDLTHLITHLRSALPTPEIVQSTTDFIFVDPHRIWSDTYEFVRLLRCHHAQPSVALLAEASALMRGSLMDGFALDECAEFEEWLTIERSIWEHRHLAVVEAIERESRKSGELALAIDATPSAFLVEPMDAEAHRRLVQARLAA